MSEHQPRKRYPVTPRRVTVDLAPDDSEMFVEGVQELEMRSEIELDLDEVSGEPPPWGKSEDGEADGENIDRTERGNRGAVLKTSPRLSRPLHTSEGKDIPAVSGLRQSQTHETSIQRGETSRTQNSARSSRGLSGMRDSSETLILPALPEPDNSLSAVEGTEADNFSSRRAALFRSSPRTSPRPSESPSLASFRRSQELRVPLQEPLPMSIALVSTPVRSTLDVGNTSSAVTPHAPGHWQPSPNASKGNVRFSQLRTIRPSEEHRKSGLTPSPVESPTHQLRLSPAKSSSPRKARVKESQDLAAGDTSFSHRLSKTVSRGTTPQPSTTLREAQGALARAAEVSLLAQAKVERTQRQWLEALASVQNNAAVDVMRKSWGWGTWAWWVAMELLLLWGVFR